MQGRRAEPGNAVGHLLRILGELWPHGGREVEHLDPFTLQPDPGQELLDGLYSAAGVEITFQVMAITLQSAGDHDAVRAMLEGV